MRLLLLILALVLSPIGMAAAGGAAAAQTSEMAAHCAEMDMPQDDRGAPIQKIDCMSACSAVAPSQSAVAPQRVRARSMGEPLAAPTLIGSTPERETPPPRFS